MPARLGRTRVSDRKPFEACPLSRDVKAEVGKTRRRTGDNRRPKGEDPADLNLPHPNAKTLKNAHFSDVFRCQR
jgi:hypothetical protein